MKKILIEDKNIYLLDEEDNRNRIDEISLFDIIENELNGTPIPDRSITFGQNIRYKTWLDEMEFKDIYDIKTLMIRLKYYHGGMFCIDKDVLMNKFSFLNNDEKNIIQIVKKLRCEGIKFVKIKMLNTLDNLRGSYRTVYLIYDN